MYINDVTAECLRSIKRNCRTLKIVLKKFGSIGNIVFNPHRNLGKVLVEACETITPLSDNRTGVCAKTLDF